jgi:alkylation response protein AidB-like acyl-CoA dehydrogenase
VDRARIDMAATACGLGRGAMEAAAAYAKEREQFGKPIAKFQAIQHKLASIATELQAAWCMTLGAAAARDEGRPFSAEAARAKLFAARAATQACTESLQVHGGYGYIPEYHVERRLRDARLCALEHGTSEAVRATLATGIKSRFAAG